MILSFLLLLLYVTTTCGTIVSSHGVRADSKKLHRLAVDEVSGHVYVGATNTIYVRDSDLNSVAKLELGPRNDSLNCPPHPSKPCECSSIESVNNDTMKYNEDCENFVRTLTDAIVKNIIFDHKNQVVVVCTNLYYGYCSKISLDNYTVIAELFQPVVSNSIEDEAIAVMKPSGYLSSALYFGVTRSITTGLPQYKNQVHMLAMRPLDTLHIDGDSFIDVQFDLRDTFPVNFKYGFRYGGYIYFLITRKESSKSEKIASYISRVCENDPHLHSYVELKIECMSGNHEYNSVDTAYISKLGVNLAASLGLPGGEDVLFAIFSTTLQDSFTLRQDSTGICVYSLSDIKTKFSDSISYCSSGFGNTGPEHIVSPQKCQPEVLNILLVQFSCFILQ